MINAWWLVLALFVGVAIGVFFMSLLGNNGDDDK